MAQIKQSSAVNAEGDCIFLKEIIMLQSVFGEECFKIE
jgi:hypothetical protein